MRVSQSILACMLLHDGLTLTAMTEVIEDHPEGRMVKGDKVKVLYDHQNGLLTASAESEVESGRAPCVSRFFGAVG